MKALDKFDKHEGILFGWFETGTEGIVWALQEFKHVGEHWSYEGLVPLKSTDLLFVMDQDQKKVWTGVVMLDNTRTAHGYHIWGIPKGWDSKEWMKLMFNEQHVGIILRLKKGEEFPKDLKEISVTLETEDVKKYFKKK